jgi:hypothetical protein
LRCSGTNIEKAMCVPSGDQARLRRRLRQLADAGLAAAVHPAHVKLRAAVLVADIGDARAVRGPLRLGVVLAAGRERLVLSAVGIDQPEVLAKPVRHDVHVIAHIDDPPAVARDIRLRGPLQVEQVGRLEAGQFGVARAREGEPEEQEGKDAHDSAAS